MRKISFMIKWNINYHMVPKINGIFERVPTTAHLKGKTAQCVLCFFSWLVQPGAVFKTARLRCWRNLVQFSVAKRPVRPAGDRSRQFCWLSRLLEQNGQSAVHLKGFQQLFAWGGDCFVLVSVRWVRPPKIWLRSCDHFWAVWPQYWDEHVSSSKTSRERQKWTQCVTSKRSEFHLLVLHWTQMSTAGACWRASVPCCNHLGSVAFCSQMYESTPTSPPDAFQATCSTFLSFPDTKWLISPGTQQILVAVFSLFCQRDMYKESGATHNIFLQRLVSSLLLFGLKWGTKLAYDNVAAILFFQDWDVSPPDSIVFPTCAHAGFSQKRAWPFNPQLTRSIPFFACGTLGHAISTYFSVLTETPFTPKGICSNWNITVSKSIN